MYLLFIFISILFLLGLLVIVNLYLLRYLLRIGWNVWKGKLMDGMRFDFMYSVVYYIVMVVLKGFIIFYVIVNLCLYNLKG